MFLFSFYRLSHLFIRHIGLAIIIVIEHYALLASFSSEFSLGSPLAFVASCKERQVGVWTKCKVNVFCIR